MAKVSVIVPVFNVERYLGECLDSILGQTLRDIEVLCVDDGSTDSSAKILSDYAVRDNRVRVLERDGKGAARARNLGLREAIGEYVFFCDSDDWIDRDTLGWMYGAAVRPGADVAVTGMRYFDSETRRELRVRKAGADARRLPRPFAPLQLEGALFTSLRAQTGGKLFRRAFVQALELEFQDQVRANDIAFVATALAAAERIVVDDRARYHYRKNHGGNLSSRLNQMPEMSALAWMRVRENLSRLGIFEKFRSPFSRAASQALVEVMQALTDAGVARDFHLRIRGEFLRALELDAASSVPLAGVFFSEEDPMAFYMAALAETRERYRRLNARMSAWRLHPLRTLFDKMRGRLS